MGIHDRRQVGNVYIWSVEGIASHTEGEHVQNRDG